MAAAPASSADSPWSFAHFRLSLLRSSRRLGPKCDRQKQSLTPKIGHARNEPLQYDLRTERPHMCGLHIARPFGLTRGITSGASHEQQDHRSRY